MGRVLSYRNFWAFGSPKEESTSVRKRVQAGCGHASAGQSIEAELSSALCLRTGLGVQFCQSPRSRPERCRTEQHPT